MKRVSHCHSKKKSVPKVNPWRDKVKNTRRMEIVVSIVCILSIVACAVIDCFGAFPKVIVSSELATAVMQTQASVAVVILAVLALITGNMSESYLGIPIVKYYINIRPFIFKQKSCIFASLLLTVASVLFCLLNWNWSVIGCFVVTILIVFMSVLGVYRAFSGKAKEHSEIELYFSERISKLKTPDKVSEVFNNFVLDWAELADKQDSKTFEYYEKLYLDGIESLFEFKSEVALKDAQKCAYELVSRFFVSNQGAIKVRGLRLLDDTYSELQKVLSEDENTKWETSTEFSLFSDVAEIIYREIYVIDPTVLMGAVNVFYLFGLVSNVNLGLESFCEDDSTEYRSDMNAMVDFARVLGLYLSRCDIEGIVSPRRYWEGLFSDLNYTFELYKLPEGKDEKFYRYIRNVYFSYFRSMLDFSQIDIVKNGLYQKGIDNIRNYDNKYAIELYLAFHIYTYYLAKRDCCVDENAQKSANDLLNDKEVKRIFNDFLMFVIGRTNVLTSELRYEIERYLENYEWMPKSGEAKTMLMSGVVHDFWLFMIMYICVVFGTDNSLLKINFDYTELYWYCTKFNEKDVKEKFKELYLIIDDSNMSDEKINSEVDLMYDVLITEGKKIVKEGEINQASIDQAEYEKEINEEEIRNAIRLNAKKKIEETFGDSIVSFCDSDNEKTWELLKLSVCTCDLNTHILDGHYTTVCTSLLKKIIEFLTDKNIVNTLSRSEDFDSADAFIDYVSEHDYNLLLGSKLVARGRNYRDAEIVNAFLSSDNIKAVPVQLNEMLMLKKGMIDVQIHKIEVSVHPMSIEESRAVFNEQTEMYSYEIIGGVKNEFEKEELESFLHDFRKVVSIEIAVDVKTNGNSDMTLIVP